MLRFLGRKWNFFVFANINFCDREPRRNCLDRSVAPMFVHPPHTQCKKGHQKVSSCIGGGRGIRTPVGFHPNGFQDFFRNPTLTQNNRKYQTVENAENPVKSRAFGVLSFSKPETVDGARISASKTISKDFLEKLLDKSAPICPVASHIKKYYSFISDSLTTGIISFILKNSKCLSSQVT